MYGTTAENLQAAINGENFEHTQMYPEFAKIAEEEGLLELAKRLLAIGKAEEHHEERFLKLLEQIKNDTFFKKNDEKWWICRECGYAHFGMEPPEECPVCLFPKTAFKNVWPKP